MARPGSIGGRIGGRLLWCVALAAVASQSVPPTPLHAASERGDVAEVRTLLTRLVVLSIYLSLFGYSPMSFTPVEVRRQEAAAREAMAEHEEDDGFDNEAAEAMAELERRGAPRLAPEPPPRPQPPPRQEGACVDCGTEALQPKFHTAFGLHVCYDCQRRFKVSSSPQPGHCPRPRVPDCHSHCLRVLVASTSC